jgi:hypothetical protein
MSKKNKKNKSECPICLVGETTDSRRLVDGVWAMYETYGLPLDIIFDLCIQKEWMPDWMALYKQMCGSGMKHSRILSKLEESINDSFGKEFCDVVIFRLDQIFQPQQAASQIEQPLKTTQDSTHD